MALQSEVSPHLVGDPNKDTQIEGDTKSEDDSSQSTDEDVDLEEGEILDSSAEEEEKEKKDLTNSSLQEALDKNMLKSIEQLVSQAKSDTPTPVPITNKPVSPHTSPHKIKKRSSKYLDHDRFENGSDHDDGWFSPSRKSKSSKYDGKPIDYRKELEAYRGTPPSSPDSKHREKKRKRSSKKSKKSGKKTIKRKDIKGVRVSKYVKESMRMRICKFFKEGNCAKGADCAYSHASPHAFKKKEICKFYLSGYCNKGNDCIYMHDEFPCKFYHTGSECYAKDACRFSHAPLNDEMKQILADYLRCSRGDDDYDRKRRCSPSPSPERKGPPPGPPPKRTCLLGSPPRHIREAEETKRWQEEMLLHQHDNPAFKIHVSPSRDNASPPPPFPNRPNFYQETLPSTPSPKKRRNAEATNNSLSTSFPPQPPSGPLYETYSRSSPSDNFVYEEDYQDLDDEVINIKQEPPEVPEFSWTNMRGMDHNLPPIKTEVEPYADSNQQDLDFTSDVKFDETTQFSEMESSIECSASSPPNSASQIAAVNKEIEEESPNNEGIIKSEDKNDDSNSAQETVTTPIIIPSHLPKKQQELFKRIFQHQKKTAMTAAASDASNSPKHYDNTEPPEKETEDVKEKPEVEKSEPPLWYSSEEDDDDDSDEPLTDVLKKLQKEPLSIKPPVKTEPKPAADIMALLTKVKQNTVEKNKGAPESQQSEFIKNLLSGKLLSGSNVQTNFTPVSEPRRTLLPDPQFSIKKESIVAPKDPRLKNRDPRSLTASVNSGLNLPKTLEQSVLQTSSVITQDNKISTFSSSVTSVIAETVKEDIPYKLRGIYTKPPNYTPYINATQSNPSLLKDPRLRKHLNLNQTNENGIEVKKSDVPPIPKLLLAYDKLEPINIFESSSASKPATEESQDVKSLRSKLIDPRMKRRDSQNSSGSNTPPHLTAVDNILPSFNRTSNSFENEVKIKEEKKWSPPLLEKAWNPPAVEHIEDIKQEVDSDTDDPLRLEIDENPPSSSKDSEDSSSNFVKKSTPTPASHLPRAIADPRMARLHGPLDSRRLRVGSFESSSKNVELKRNSPPYENVTDASKTSPPGNTAAESGVVKTGKSIPKKKTNKSEEKKKTIHRNRKSSMDYASPLNSCDDSNSNKSLNYNSYNQRPPRASSSYAVPDSSNSTNSIISESTPDFLSDNSNLDCDNSSDVNLKDKFKTIDPTASPFC